MRHPHLASRTHLRLAALLAALLAVVPSVSAAQGFRIFRDGNGSSFWDPSYAQASGGSAVQVVNGTKCPVDYATKWRGTSSLRVRWTSQSAGDWVMGLAAPGWASFDANPLDSLVWWAYSSAAIPAADLPHVMVEDALNRRSIRQGMGAYNPAGLPAGAWTRLVMPLAPIKANPGTADMARINKAFFAQNPTAAMNVQRTMWVDELRFAAADATPPATPGGLQALGYERHVDVIWGLPVASDVESHRIERLVNGAWTPITWVDPRDGGAMIWVGASAACTLRVAAEDWSFRSSAPGPEFALATRALSDADFMDMIQRSTFRYFWQGAHPVSGMARERTSSGDVCASGGTGFGLMGIPVGIERGYVTRGEGVARVLQVLGFLATQAERHWGAFPHWIHGATGQHLPFLGPNDDTVDIVETAYLAQAFLTLRQYFDGPGADEAQIRALATQLWQDIEWDAFLPAPTSNTVRWHRSPTTGFGTATVAGWNEAAIVYLLGIASPTHALPAATYHNGWARFGAMAQNGTYYGYRLYVGSSYGGPMFFGHYSFLGFDPRFKRDAYANYYTHNRNQALVQIAYCAANPFGYYDYSATSWGLTASDDPFGYSAHAPYANDNGTLTPTAALASMPYVPQQAVAAGRHWYETWGAYAYGWYGFKDALNPGQGWFATDELAIDQGPIVAMIENHRTGLLWDRFMRNPEIAPMMAAVGFVADSGSVTLDAPGPGAPRSLRLAASPNPARGPVAFTLDLPADGDVVLEVFDLAGRRLADVRPGVLAAGRRMLEWSGRGEDGRPPAPGVYLARVHANGETAGARIVRVR